MTENVNEDSENQDKNLRREIFRFLGITCLISIIILVAGCYLLDYGFKHQKFESVVTQLNRLSKDAEKSSDAERSK